MSKRMSRRAVLRAIGISPAILSLASVEVRAEEQQRTTRIVDERWSESLTNDLDEVVKKGKKFYKDHHKKDWNGDEETKYRTIARNLNWFYEEGIDFLAKTEGKRFAPPEHFLLTACDYPGTTTGTSVAKNLHRFTGDHGRLDVETEICAWRCGKAAAEKELAKDPNATTVSAESYALAWTDVFNGVKLLRSKLPRGDMRSFGGGC